MSTSHEQRHGHRHSPPGQHEHEHEAQPGLPEPLPADERLLWQGSPSFRSLALKAFHVRKVAIYFALLLGWRAVDVASETGSVVSTLVALLWLLPLALFALGTLLALAWMTARATMYTVTSKRVIMRIGIVLTLTFNLPLRRIVAAGLNVNKDGSGDIPLQLGKGDRIAWLHLWPHARPWKLGRPEPMLRGLADVRPIAQLLAQAWVQANELPAGTMNATAATPVAAAPAPSARAAHASVQPLATAH